MARRWSVLGCAGVMLVGLTLPTAAEDKAAKDKATLSGLKSTKAAELGAVRGSVVVREKRIVKTDSVGQPRQTTERVTDPLGKAEEELSGPDENVVEEIRGSGAGLVGGGGLTSGVGGAFGSDLSGFTAPLVRSVNPNR